MRSTALPSLDLVIPLFNEEPVIHALVERLEKTFSESQRAKYRLGTVHYVFVDDGSRDHTAKEIASRIRAGLPATLLRLSRNFGHQCAVSAGLMHARADLVAVLDADLQDPPEVVLQMVEKWREGFDVVYGRRTKRKENIIKRFCYWSFYRLFAYLSEVEVGLDSGDFSLMDREVVTALRELPEKLRYPRLLRSWVGFRQFGLVYERDARELGTTKYSFRKLYKLATDGIASASIRPLKVAQFCCLIFGLVSFVFFLISTKNFLFYRGNSEIAQWFCFTYFLISLTGCMVMFILYIISAYVGRTYLEVKGRPTFIVQEVINKNG